MRRSSGRTFWIIGFLAGLAAAFLSLIRLRQRTPMPDHSEPTAEPLVIPTITPTATPPVDTAMRMPVLLLGSAVVFILMAVLSLLNQNSVIALLWGGIAVVQVGLARRARSFSMVNVQRYVEHSLTTFYAHHRRGFFLTFSVLPVLAAFLASWDGQFDGVVINGWLVGMVAWWTVLSGKVPSLPKLPHITLNREIVALGVILVVGAFALYYNLDNLPRDMISDHAEYLLDTAEVQAGRADIYFGNNSGREPVFLYSVALVSDVIGTPSFLSLKLVSATAAFLTLPLLYLLGREVGGGLTGLLTVGVGSVCLWSIIMGRVGFRVALASLATTALLVFLWRALRHGRRSDFLLAGLVLGLGQYGYSSFRIAPLVVLLGVGLCLLRPNGIKRRDLLANTLAMFVMALVAFVPLLSYAIHFPEIFWTRTSNLVGALGLDAFLQALVDSLLMFNFGSDEVWMNVLQPDAHVLPTLEGILFLLGIAFFIWQGIKRRDPMLLFVPLAFVVLLLPSPLGVGTPLETPSARRAITALPVVVLMMGSSLAMLVEWLARRYSRQLAYAFGGGVLTLMAVTNLSDYATYYPPSYRPAPARDVGQQITQFDEADGDLSDVYFVYGEFGGWVDPRLIAIWIGEPFWNGVVPSISPINCLPNDGEPMMAIVAVGDRANTRRLRRCFPDGWSVDLVTPEGHRFTVFLVNSSYIPHVS